jgi:hypothetical protein
MSGVATYPMPSDVEVDAMGDHARYLLPRRQLGAVRFFGLLPIAMGLMILSVLLLFFRPLEHFSKADPASRAFAIGFSLFMLAFMFPVFRMMVFGLIVIAGRSEIRLINGKLTAREHAGPFFWTRRSKKPSPIQRVSVGYGDGTVTINGKPTDRFSNLARLAALGVEAGPDKKDRFLLTIGYSKEMLLAVGQDLAQRLHVEFREGLMKGDEWVESEEKAESSST